MKTSIRLVPLAQKGPPASRARREPQKAQHCECKVHGALKPRGRACPASEKQVKMERMHSFESDLGSVPNSDTFQALHKHVFMLSRGPAAHGTHMEPALWQAMPWSPPPSPGLPPAPRQKPTSVLSRLPCSKGSVWISVPASMRSTRFLSESTGWRGASRGAGWDSFWNWLPAQGGVASPAVCL